MSTMRSDTPPNNDEDISDEYSLPEDEEPEIIENAEVEEYIPIDSPEHMTYEDQASITFRGHTKSVFCCAVDKTGSFAASGGQDDKAFIWNPRDGSVILECTGYSDSVVYTSFSHDSKYLATGDMCGNIQVWKLSQSIERVWSYSTNEDLRFLDWHHSSNVLFGGTIDGALWLWCIPGGNLKMLPQPGNSPCSYGYIMPDGLRAIVGYDDGIVRFYDMKASKILHSVEGSAAHTDTVSSIDCYKDNNIVASGSTDGTVKLIKSSNGQVICTLHSGPDNPISQCIECVKFFSDQSLLAAGTVGGKLTVWDVPTQARRFQVDHDTTITKLFWDPDSPIVYTAGADGVVRVLDGRTGEQEKMWTGHTLAILDFTMSVDKSMLVTASDDSTCKVFDLQQR